MKRLLYFFGGFICRRGVCRITAQPVWVGNEIIGWSDECERCGESQFKPVGVP